MQVSRGSELCSCKAASLYVMLPIEAEMLAVVLACRKFHQYIYGRSTVVETDHKSLQAKAQTLVTSSIETAEDDPQSAWL